jgi:hypothetical protein
MLSWRCDVGDGTGIDSFVMALLLDDARIARRFSPKTKHDQQLVQVSKRVCCHARRSDLHPDAGNRIQHPRRQDCDYTRQHLDMNKAAGLAPLAALPPDTLAVKRVPTVINFNFLSDMGRMNG